MFAAGGLREGLSNMSSLIKERYTDARRKCLGIQKYGITTADSPCHLELVFLRRAARRHAQVKTSVIEEFVEQEEVA